MGRTVIFLLCPYSQTDDTATVFVFSDRGHGHGVEQSFSNCVRILRQMTQLLCPYSQTEDMAMGYGSHFRTVSLFSD